MEDKKYWNLKDIKEYLECGTNIASQIRKIAITQYNGLCFYNHKKVKKESCLQAIKYLEERG